MSPRLPGADGGAWAGDAAPVGAPERWGEGPSGRRTPVIEGGGRQLGDQGLTGL